MKGHNVCLFATEKLRQTNFRKTYIDTYAMYNFSPLIT